MIEFYPQVRAVHIGAVLVYEQVFVKPASGPALLSSPSTHLIVDGSL